MMPSPFPLSEQLQPALRVLLALGHFFHPRTGAEYAVHLPAKILLLFKIMAVKRRVSGSNDLVELLAFSSALLNVPRVVEGCAVECGCSGGRAAVVLSFVCTLCNRRLELFPAQDEKTVAFDQLREQLVRYGDITSCHVNVGDLDQTLPRFTSWCVFALVDAELPATLDTCLRYLWPLLQERCPLFIPSARLVEFGARFYDKLWWQGNVQAAAPELAGTARGVGYALKLRSV